MKREDKGVEEGEVEAERGRQAKWKEGETEDEDAAEEENTLPCVCGGHPAHFDGTWVGCDVCGRWVHSCCAGDGWEGEQGEEDGSYACLHCACRENAASPLQSGESVLHTHLNTTSLLP